MADWTITPPRDTGGWSLTPPAAAQEKPTQRVEQGWTITPPAKPESRPTAPPALPFEDKPGEERGAILPFKTSPGEKRRTEREPRSVELALPSIITSPIRGMVETGQQMMGKRPINPEGLSDDQLAAVMATGNLRAPGKMPVRTAPKAAPEVPTGVSRETFAEPSKPILATEPQPQPAGAAATPPDRRVKGVSAIGGEASRLNSGRLVDDFRSIFNPAARGPEAQTTAAITREGSARAEQQYQQAAENLRSFGRVVGNVKPLERLAYIDAIETGKLDAYKGSPLYDFGREVRKNFDDRYQKMVKLDIAPSYVTDYFPHLWKDPRKAAETFERFWGKRSLEGGKAFKRERTFKTISEGMRAGLEPVTDNPIEMALLQLHQMDRYITAHEIFNEMKAEGIAVAVKSGEREPVGWIPIDDKIARAGATRYYAPEPAATIINRHLSPGLSGKPVFDFVRSTGNMLNGIQLGFSGFHAGFVAFDAGASRIAKGIKQISRGEPGEIAKGLGNIFFRGPTAPIENYLTGRKLLNAYLGKGQYGPRIEKIVDALIAGGGRVRMDQFYRGSAAGSFWQAMRGSLLKQSGRSTLGQELAEMFRTQNPVRAAAQLIPRVMDTIMAPLFEDIVPKMKLGVFYDLMSDELRVNPNMSDATLRLTAGRIWDSVDNRLGQLVYDNLFWNRQFKDLGHIGVRALGWNLGTLRELGGGALDIRRGRPISAGEMRQITDRASYVIAVPIMTAMFGALYQYLKIGKGPQELKDYFFPKTGGIDAQGGPERINAPGYFKDVVEWSTHPLQTGISKVHPMWPMLWDMMNNEQWFGGAITDPRLPVGTQIADYAEWMARNFTPMSMQQSQYGPGTKLSTPERLMGLRQAPFFIREPEKAEEWEQKKMYGKYGKVSKKLEYERRQQERSTP